MGPKIQYITRSPEKIRANAYMYESGAFSLDQNLKY